MDNQMFEGLNLSPEQEKMLSLLYQMMEWQGKGKQMELMIELWGHLTAAKDVMEQLQSGYGY